LYHICQEFSRERKADLVWFFSPLESHRLTEQDITDFVNCIKEYVFISIFNKDYAEKAVKACQHLSFLRPELIVPVIVEKYVNLFFNTSLNLYLYL
jgi:proteasome activator subunit 4